MADSQKITFGAAPDLQLFHDASNSYIETTSGSAGDLYIKSNGTGHDLYLQATDDVFIRPQSSNDGIKVIGGGAVELYHNAVKKFETTSTGVSVTGDGNITGITRTNEVFWGNAYANGKLSWDTGYALIQGQSGNGIKFQPNASTALILDTSGNAEFKGNVEIDGNLTVDGNIIHGGTGNGGTYNFSDTVNASSNENIFSIQSNHGAQAFTVYFTCNTTSMSVAKAYTIVHSYGTTVVYNKLVDSGPFGGEDFTPTFTGFQDTVTCNISNLSTSINADIVTTVVLGGSPTALTVTAL
jgi:hypothetical protein